MTTATSERLEAIAAELRREHAGAVRAVAMISLATTNLLDHAHRCGDLLLDAKALLQHGEFRIWLSSETEMSPRTAQVYMRIARHWDEVAANAQTSAHLTIQGMLDLLSPPEEEDDQAPEHGPDPEPEPRAIPADVPEPDSAPTPARPLLRFCQDLPTATIVTLILRVAFPDAASCLDPTYGNGAFWDGSAHVRVTGHDLDPTRAPDGSMDFRDLVYADASFDVVALDPPHLADAGTESIMGQRFGSYDEAELYAAIRKGVREAWRVSRLGIVVKVCDHVHGQRFQSETEWVREAIGEPLYEIVHQVRSAAMVDPRWEEQLSAYNNGASYLIFRHGDARHVRRARSEGLQV